VVDDNLLWDFVPSQRLHVRGGEVFNGSNWIYPSLSSGSNEGSVIRGLGAGAADAIVTSGLEGPAPVVIDHKIPLKTYRERLALWSSSPGPLSELFIHSYQPLVIFATIPAVFYTSLVYSIINATITIMITVLSEYMYSPSYNFNSAQVSLMSLPPFVATTLSLLIVDSVLDWSILFLAKRNKGIYEPKMRLWVIAAFISFVPAGSLCLDLVWPMNHHGRCWVLVMA
jgi:hypothetical protein